ncbi:phage tail tube protein [Rhodococcus sp. IEGM 1374]|uniref:phage tail tube protein n=1 Tax=Rhodococcus sp. IEGM 1374 TaxID=3082221 RepID=UPI0029533A57|nr:phage tail tube protein [Rhodococcus sp. IEGM 1374]MDV7992059.1 phage tail tube protein [Rhodococcus sp. IEGM 1374]
MATNPNPDIARRNYIGIGIGNNVAAQTWIRWLDEDVRPMTEVIENDSAMGVVEEINDSEVAAKWVEGNLGGKITVQSFGFILLNHYGAVSTGTAVSGKYPHTFSVSQLAVAPVMTYIRKTPLSTKRHNKLTIDTLEITAEEKAYVTYSSAIKATIGTESTETPAFITESEFQAKNIVVKEASTAAALSAADPKRVISFKLNSERPSEAEFTLGNDDDPDFYRQTFKANGEMVVNYQDTAVDDELVNNTIRAMSITMTNGTDELSFTMTKVKTRELERSSDKNEKVTATIQFIAEYDATVGRAIQPLLKNARASYTAA